MRRNDPSHDVGIVCSLTVYPVLPFTFADHAAPIVVQNSLSTACFVRHTKSGRRFSGSCFFAAIVQLHCYGSERHCSVFIVSCVGPAHRKETAVVDFTQLKTLVTIENVVALLNLPLKKSGEQLRGACPICEDDNPRAFVITPAKQLFYCFKCEKGGDQIQLFAEVKKLDVKQAANDLERHFKATPPETAMDPLDYLQHDHAAVEALGLPAEAAKAIGAGYAGKGVCRGRVAIPIRLPNGKLAGYIGINLAHDQPLWVPKTWKL